MATAVVVNATGGTANDAGENVQSEKSAPVVDLLQVYPGYTNNLNVVGFVDENVMENRQICMNMCPVALRNYENIMLGLLLCISLTLFISIWTIMGEIASWGYYRFWSVILYMLPSIILLSIKLFVTLQFYRFRKEKDGSSVIYHEAGRKFYFSFYGDSMFSLLAGVWFLLLSSYYCHWISDACISTSSFERNSIFATIIWLYTIPELLYVIIGYFLVYKIKSSDFEMYNKNWAFRKFDISNDVTYCLDYQHARSNTITSNTVLCRCCGDCPNGTSGCACEQSCDGCCCGTCGSDCCNSGVKCSLFAISVWQILVSTQGLWLVLMGLVYMIYWLTWALETDDSDDSSDDWYYYSFAWAAQYLEWGLGGLAFHFVPGYYGIRLINYKYPCTCCNCCSNENETAAERFHDLSIKAMRAYSALAVLYYIAFMVWFWMFFVSSLSYGYFQVTLLIVTILFGFICWLPFEGLKLIDTFIKTENYQARHGPNGINMDSFNFKNQEVAQNGSNNVSADLRQTNDNAQDGAVITALQVASTDPQSQA